MKDIEVRYIYGFPKEEFNVLKNIDDLEINIPEENPNFLASELKPEEYVIIFSLFFASKVVEKLFDKVSEKISDKIISSIIKIWKKAKKNKPCIIQSNVEPIFKEPKALILFKISDDENSKFEITPNMTDKEIKKSMKTFIKLVKLQHKNRKNEKILKLKIKNN